MWLSTERRDLIGSMARETANRFDWDQINTRYRAIFEEAVK